MTQRKRPEGTFWQKASYIAANDNNAVAIFRSFQAFMASLGVALVYHYGSALSTTQENQGKILALHDIKIELLTSGEAAASERLKMIEDRDIRMLDRLNINTNEITALKTLNAALPRR